MLTLVAKFIYLLLILSNVESWLLDQVPSDPDDSKTLTELVQSHGFKLEKHYVTTEDGYILRLDRLTNGNLSKNLKPIILQHGAFSTSAVFLTNSPFLQSRSSKYGDTIAFSVLLTNRYDVWMPNNRGTRYTRLHVKLDPSDSEFWKFNLDDLALKDLPTSIAYIRNVTKYEKIAFVGHSQGNTLMFELLSLRPEYADIIQPFIALGPIVFLSDVINLFPFGIFNGPFLDSAHKFFMLKNDKVLPFPLDLALQEFWNTVCLNELSFCLKLFSTISNKPYTNYTRIGVYSHFFPTTISFKMLAHLIQLIRTGKFQQFNYGSKLENIKYYGTPEAPDIPLENIPKHTKIALFSSNNDGFARPKDVEHLRQFFHIHRIPLIKDYIVPNNKWTHYDFVIGLDSGRYFIDEMINLLDQYAFNSTEL